MPVLPKVLPGRYGVLVLACLAMVLPTAEALSTREERKVDQAARNADWVQLWDQYVDLFQKDSASTDSKWVEQFLRNWLLRDFLMPVARREVPPIPSSRSLARSHRSLRTLINRHPFLDTYPWHRTGRTGHFLMIHHYRQNTPEGKVVPYWIVLFGQFPLARRENELPLSLTVMELLSPAWQTLGKLGFRISYPQGRASPVFGGYGTRNHQVADLLTPEMGIRVYSPALNVPRSFAEFYFVIYPTQYPPTGIFERAAAGVSLNKITNKLLQSHAANYLTVH